MPTPPSLLPSGPFTVVLADPPWTYTDKAHSGERGVEYKYDCMTLNDICTLPVDEIAAEDSALYLAGFGNQYEPAAIA